MSPSLLERVTHRPPRPPASFHPMDVRDRWQAMKVLHKAQSARERAR